MGVALGQQSLVFGALLVQQSLIILALLRQQPLSLSALRFGLVLFLAKTGIRCNYFLLQGVEGIGVLLAEFGQQPLCFGLALIRSSQLLLELVAFSAEVWVLFTLPAEIGSFAAKLL